MRRFLSGIVMALFASAAVVWAYGCNDSPVQPAAAEAATVQEEASSTAVQTGAFKFWTTSGNGGTDPAMHFLGTADDQPLVVKTNGAEVIRVNTDGSIGIGTDDPWGSSIVHIRGNAQGPELLLEETFPGSAAFLGLRNTVRTWYLFSDASPDNFAIFSNGLTAFTILGGSGNVGLGTPTPGHPLEMASGAHVTSGGVWTDASSRAYKENIRELTSDQALAALDALTPVRFNYRTQDRKGLSPMDIVAVLTKVVQEQGERIAELEAQLGTP
jgi:hypothetical protein